MQKEYLIPSLSVKDIIQLYSGIYIFYYYYFAISSFIQNNLINNLFFFFFKGKFNANQLSKLFFLEKFTSDLNWREFI